MADIEAKRLDLASHGGGSQGAITWGVPDHILEDERQEIHAVIGTSAGALALGLARRPAPLEQ